MSYVYVAIDKNTGLPVSGGHKKYHLTHQIKGGTLNPEELKFFRIKEGNYLCKDEVTEMTLKEI